jgi:maltooligosyltrehalose synthase
VIGSPYAVVDYNCNPELGTNDDIIALKKYLNNMGLKLMLDFVGNHAAIDSK